MSYANPTALQLGMRGTFENREFRIVGRVVMGMDDSGETYYWNEFNLVSASGLTATLVYEEGERGGEWRLFTLFEPDYPLTAAEAARKRVGDRLNLTETEVRVTMRDQSRVYFIEGQPPEGVEVGDIAEYFNAEAPGVMQVVSWTGDEVECYNGVQLTAMDVQRAFKLARAAAAPVRNFSSFSVGENSGEYLGTAKFFIYAVIGVLFVIFLFGGMFGSCGTLRKASPAKRFPAGPPPLVVGAEGQWNERHYRITARALVEVGEVNSVRERHEYELSDENGVMSLLICGLRPDETNWFLCQPLSPYPQPSPQVCATLKKGEFASVDGVTGFIDELFQCTIQNTDHVTPTIWRPGEVSFGYTAKGGDSTLFVRWDKISARFYRAQKISARDFAAQFKK